MQGCLLPLSATKGTATHAPTYTMSTDCNPNERILQRLVWSMVCFFVCFFFLRKITLCASLQSKLEQRKQTMTSYLQRAGCKAEGGKRCLLLSTQNNTHLRSSGSSVKGTETLAGGTKWLITAGIPRQHQFQWFAIGCCQHQCPVLVHWDPPCSFPASGISHAWSESRAHLPLSHSHTHTQSHCDVTWFSLDKE